MVFLRSFLLLFGSGFVYSTMVVSTRMVSRSPVGTGGSHGVLGGEKVFLLLFFDRFIILTKMIPFFLLLASKPTIKSETLQFTMGMGISSLPLMELSLETINSSKIWPKTRIPCRRRTAEPKANTSGCLSSRLKPMLASQRPLTW